jgi:deoxyribodipyrimidine photo-lyase
MHKSSSLAPKKINGLFWFTNDLRVHDNPALARAARDVDTLICVFCFDQQWLTPNRFGSIGLGKHRQRFLEESLQALHIELLKLNQSLIIVRGHSDGTIDSIIEDYKIDRVYCSRNAGFNEQKIWAQVSGKHNDVLFTETDSHTLFDLDSLPFEVNDLPESFTKFRKIAEQFNTEKPITKLSHLPPSPVKCKASKENENTQIAHNFRGGEAHGFRHLERYFSGDLPAHYKEVRNAIDGWNNSCKFSPWLANGSLSAREILHWLNDYETNKVKNDSTYWIYFELLWREYFQWLAHKLGSKLFRLSGISKLSPLTSYYPERFQKWVAGNTPYPLVNACMKELAATGFLSNRGRQIVASCFVNELAMDWRYGAAYFEQVLVDYDVAVNWGNWQYLAGVGADTRDKRHFNLEKQTNIFDAKGFYRTKWGANKELLPLDSVDAADWPI